MDPLKTDLEEAPVVSSEDTAPEASDSETAESSWESLADAFDAPEDPEELTSESEGQEVSSPEPEPEIPVAEGVSASPKEREEIPAPEPEVVAEPERKVEETPPEPPAPRQTEEERRAIRGQVVEQLTQKYQLGKEEAEAWELNPVEVLPKYAAELHMRIYDDVVNSVVQQMPGLMDWHLKAKEDRAARENTFFSAWPELKGYDREVTQIAQMWRQMNPTADEKTAIESIGKIALGALDLRREAPPVPAASPPSDVGRGSPPVPSRSTQAGSRNPFEALDAAWDEEID